MRVPHGSSLSHHVLAFGIRPRTGMMPTMPSADFCSITPRVAPSRAAGALGSGGRSRSFGLGLSPAPMAVPDRSSSRSPRIRACTVAAQPRHLPDLPYHRASTCGAVSPQRSGPSMPFVFLGSQLCRGLPSDDPSRRRLCRKLVIRVVHSVDGGSLTGDLHPTSTCPCRAYTTSSRRTRAAVITDFVLRRSMAPGHIQHLVGAGRSSVTVRRRTSPYSFTSRLTKCRDGADSNRNVLVPPPSRW